MLIKEYRIPLPLSVEEYKIAQLYMIAKKSKEESQGTGSGVEILKNEPFNDVQSGSGQYTYKIYHVGQHLPAWLKALLPKSALVVEEKAWNSYPYTKTRYTCPFIEKFSIEIETKYFNDCGNQSNVFSLSNSEINRQIDVIDIVKEQMTQSEYIKEDDPKVYKSEKTQRGPLTDNWVVDYWANGNPTKPIMCAYKLCRVEFKYWGMQNKIEKFIHDSALRSTMVKAHQQAWVWQDEWIDLTMADIRRLEIETQEYLKKQMADNSEQINEPSTHDSSNTLASSNASQVDFNIIDKDNENCHPLPFELPKTKKSTSLSQYSLTPSNISSASKDTIDDQQRRKDSHSSKQNSRTTLQSPGECIDAMSAWRIRSLARDSDSSSDDQFYDAEDINDDENTFAYPPANENIPAIDLESDNIFSTKFIQQVQSDLIFHNKSLGKHDDESASESLCNSPIHNTPCPISTLIIILHGGSVLDVGSEASASKSLDITTFQSTMNSIVNQYYTHLIGRIAIRYVSCPSICHDSLLVLSSLSPYSVQSSPTSNENLSHTFDSIPFGALPLFAISSFEYQENVINVISQCNKVYAEFIKSQEGNGFNGKVSLIGDSVGAILGFDALCQVTSNQHNIYGSESSIQDAQDSCKSSNPIISITDLVSQHEISETSKLAEQSQPNSLSIKPKVNYQPKTQVYCKSLSHPGDFSHSNTQETSNRLFISSTIRRRSSGSSDLSSTKLDFEVCDFFMFGSLVGIILTYRKMLNLDDKSLTMLKPACTNLFNLFHLSDPSALRIEPLLSARFSYIPPVNIPRYQMFPLGDGQPIHLLEYLQTFSYLFSNDNGSNQAKTHTRRTSEISISSNSNSPIEILNSPNISSLMQRWFGSKRIDYALYCPEGICNFPPHSLPHLFHASYWESCDVISFILRQLNKFDLYSINNSNSVNEQREVIFKPNQPREKWQRKRTSVKIKNITANHRANDVIVKEGLDQTIFGRFMYGPLDVITLAGEKVDLHIRSTRNEEWSYLATEFTDKNGRIVHTIPKEKSLSCGLYQFKMIVRGDHTCLDLFLAVVPPKTEAVVFSIDGSLTASVSVSGRDPKVRAGSVDVVRFWQELGYLIIYITGRPDIQQQPVVSWLTQHNFPHGLIFFVDGLSTDPLRHKAEYLRNLNKKMEIIFRCAYGSSKDISVYQSIEMKPEQIYIVGKVSKKQQLLANTLNDGYVAHLEDLKAKGLARPAQGNARITLPKGGFIGFRSKLSQKAKRTISYPSTSINHANQFEPANKTVTKH